MEVYPEVAQGESENIKNALLKSEAFCIYLIMKHLSFYPYLIIVFILLHQNLLGQENKTTKANNKISKELKLNANECFLVNAVLKLDSQKVTENRWKPTTKQVKQMRTLYDTAVKNGVFDGIKTANFQSNYFFQYIPYINNYGEKIILINAVIYNSETYNTSTDDAGTNFCEDMIEIHQNNQWQLFLNLDSNSYSYLYLL